MANLELSDRLLDFAVKVGGLMEKLLRSLFCHRINSKRFVLV